MRTVRSALPAFLCLALLGLPALSLAAPLAAANGEAAGCPDPAEDVDADGVPPQKPTAAKRGAARDAGKPRQTTPYRSGDTPSRGAPRWHRFLPGMYR
jgi:hypothetical protein